VFQLQDRPSTRPSGLFDGSLVKGRGIVQQIGATLRALQVATTFKAKTPRAGHKLRKVTEELERLRNLVVRDDLTCLYNLRFFNRSLEAEHSRALRFGRHYSLIFIDLDGLKEVNTRFGHMAGGQVLRRLGEHLNESLRRIDIPARVGGDEFVIICPETSKLSARILADRIRQGIEELKLHKDKKYPGITASMGVASFPDDGDSAELVLERADQALYEAKARGKNSVCCWGDFSLEKGNRTGFVHNKIIEGESDDDTTA
jgi:diguanylate cyclase (GGDEF)-like protein